MASKSDALVAKVMAALDTGDENAAYFAVKELHELPKPARARAVPAILAYVERYPDGLGVYYDDIRLARNWRNLITDSAERCPHEITLDMISQIAREDPPTSARRKRVLEIYRSTAQRNDVPRKVRRIAQEYVDKFGLSGNSATRKPAPPKPVAPVNEADPDELPTIRTSADLLAALRRFKPWAVDGDNIGWFHHVLRRKKLVPPTQLLRSLLEVLSRYPDNTDLGHPGPIVHTIETLPNYLPAVLAAAGRRPSYYAVFMLSRAMNGKLPPARRRAIVSLADQISRRKSTPWAALDLAESILDRNHD